MYVKLVIFYSVVIYSQGVVSGINIGTITNAQNKHGQLFIGNPNTHNLKNPFLLTSTTKMIPQLSPFQIQQQNIIDSARAQLPLNQNLKQQSIIYRRNNLVPNEQSIVNKYRESSHQNLQQLGQEINNFPVKRFINGVDLHRNEQILAKTFDARYLVRNTDIRSDNLNRKETTTFSNKQPVSIAVYKDKQPEKIIPILKQSNIVTNFGTGIKNNFPGINHQGSSNNRGNDPPLRAESIENKNNIQPAPKTRYVFIRKSGNVEYFDNLETILKKYPYLNLTKNVPHLVPNSLPQKIIKQTVNSNVFNTKTNESVIQYNKVQAQDVSLQKRFEVNNFPNYGIQNNSEPLRNLQKIEREFKNSQLSTHPTITTHDQGIKVKMPIVEENPNILKISQNTQQKSNIKETPEMEQLIDVPIAKTHIGDLKNFTEIANITEEVKTKTSQIHKMKVAPASLSALNNHVNLSYQEKLSNNQTENIGNLNEKTKEVSSVQDLSNLNDRQVVDKPAPDESKKIVNEHSLNTSKQSMVKEKITYKEENSNSALKTQERNVQFQTKQAKTIENDKAITIMNTQDDISFDHIVDISKSEDSEEGNSTVSKPILWVRTNDPEFWNKLVDANDAYSFVYIINVQSQPKIERETNKTVYANGTVVEELTETVWENGDEKPKVMKTVKVTSNAVNG